MLDAGGLFQSKETDTTACASNRTLILADTWQRFMREHKFIVIFQFRSRFGRSMRYDCAVSSFGPCHFKTCSVAYDSLISLNYSEFNHSKRERMKSHSMNTRVCHPAMHEFHSEYEKEFRPGHVCHPTLTRNAPNGENSSMNQSKSILRTHVASRPLIQSTRCP